MKPADVEPFFTDKLASCTSFCEKVTTPSDAIVIESASLAAPIVPPSLMSMSSTNVTIPVDAIVIAEVELATPIVPPSVLLLPLMFMTGNLPAVPSPVNSSFVPLVPWLSIINAVSFIVSV